MKKTVTLNNKEQKRLSVLNEVIAGRMTGQHAVDKLDCSVLFQKTQNNLDQEYPTTMST